MLSRQFRQLLLRQRLASRRNMSGHHEVPENYKHLVRPNMDAGYPLPNKLYSEAYAARQSKYNKMLVLSGLFFLTSIIYTTSIGTYDFLAPPPREVKTWQ